MTNPIPTQQPHDPHPSDEEHVDRERHPGGAHPPTNDLGPNPAIHDDDGLKKPDYRRPEPSPGA